MLPTFVLFKDIVMEYVIKVRDKRVYEAILVFLRTLGFNASEVHAETAKSIRETSRSAALLAEDDANTLGLAAFDAGFGPDEEDISSWVVKEPNPKYGK